jgi:hypothetical protein
MPPEKVIIDVIKEPKKAEPSIKRPTVAIKPIAKPIKAASPPGPFKTDAVRAPLPEEKPPVPTTPKKKPLSSISIDSEMESIRSTINKGDLKQALSYTYVASRKIAITHGFAVPDSMTHNEFSACIEKAYPVLTQPLMTIIRPYEVVTYARHEVNSTELNSAINGLKEFYMGLENAEEGIE